MHKNRVEVTISKKYDYPKSMLDKKNLKENAIEFAKNDFFEDLDSFNDKVFEYDVKIIEDVPKTKKEKQLLNLAKENKISEAFLYFVYAMVSEKLFEKYGVYNVSPEETPQLYKEGSLIPEIAMDINLLISMTYRKYRHIKKMIQEQSLIQVEF